MVDRKNKNEQKNPERKPRKKKWEGSVVQLDTYRLCTPVLHKLRKNKNCKSYKLQDGTYII
jgi:hypothetical protein